MQEQFDKRLADKIRSEMEGYAPPLDPAHWADMQKRMGRDTSAIPKKIFTLFTILLLVGVAYLPFGNATLENNFNLLNQHSLAESQQSENDIALEEKAAIFTPKSKENEALEVIEKQQRAAKSDNQKQLLPDNQKLPIDLAKGNSGNAESGLDAAKKTTANEEGGNMTGGANSLIDVTNQKNTPLGFGTQYIENTNNKDQLTNKTADQHFGDLSLINKPLFMDSAQVATELVTFGSSTANSLLSLPKFSFSIVAEGFLNQNNRINNYRKPGFGFGALLNFKPGNKFMFSTGLILEKLSGKTFPNQSEFDESASSLDLEAIPGFSASSLNQYAANTQEKAELVTITGNFTAVEIPLQFSYYILSNNKKRFYVSSAVSSYFYLSEKYVFEKEKFQIPSQSNVRKLSIVNEEESYGAFEHVDLFSNITFSAGMERKVGLRSSLSIEPFFRLPIRRMGLENVPVNTTGIRLKYNFGR